MTEAIQSALTAFEKETENHKVLVLFTDGEDHDSGVEAEAEKAGKEGLRIFTIGVGTAEGELIRVPDEQGALSFLKDDSGNAVKSRLDETLLRKISVRGFYLPLQGAKAMETLYAQGLAPLPKSDSTTKLVRQYRERFHWPLGIAMLLLVLEMFLPHRKRVTRAATSESSAGDALTTTAITVLALVLGTLTVNASPASALREYEAGNFRAALDEFKKLSRQKTNDLRLSYNAGTAAYRAKEFDEAQKFLGAAAASPDLTLQQQAYYNLGNTLFEAGEKVPEPDKKKEAWEGSAQSFANTLKLNSQDADAKHNLALVKKRLEELEKQQQQQKQQSKDDKSDDKNKQKDKDKQKGDDQKDQNKKQDSPPEDQEQKDDQGQKQDQAKGDKEEKEEQKKAEQQAKDEKNKEEERQEAMDMAAGKMTQEQAKQFLDAQKQDDKPLIFAPPKKAQQQNRLFKDW